MEIGKLDSGMSFTMAGEKVIIKDAKAELGDNPIILFIEGDGIGPDIWKASQHVLDSAVKIAYNSARKIEWKEVLAGEKA